MAPPFLTSFWDFKLDPKKRVCLPAQYREALRRGYGSEEVVLTITPDRCLAGHPAAEWPRIAEQSKSWLQQGANGAAFRRLFLAMAQVVEPDPHGRTVLPARLHAFAGLGGVVHFIGFGNRFEIWDRDRFAAVEGQVDLEALKTAYEQVASELPVQEG